MLLEEKPRYGHALVMLLPSPHSTLGLTTPPQPRTASHSVQFSGSLNAVVHTTITNWVNDVLNAIYIFIFIKFVLEQTHMSNRKSIN